ncbi:MAG: polysaccharide biosynthesis/export family protein [Nonlabens sp.]
MKNFFALVILALFVTSCIPTSRITYLQDKEEFPKDSLLTIQRVQSPYRLQVGDIIAINIKAPFDSNFVSEFQIGSARGGGGNAQQVLQGGLYFTGFTISNRGTIRVPQLGEISVVSKTLEEVRLQIEALLFKTNFKQTSDIFVDVKLEGLRYTMVGEVNSPGQYTILRDQVSIVEAVADGGGVPVTGDLTSVKIIRQYEGGIKTHILDLTSIEVIKSPYYYLRPNDMIVFSPLPQKALGVGTTGLSTFTTAISIFTTIITTYLLIDNLSNR